MVGVTRDSEPQAEGGKFSIDTVECGTEKQKIQDKEGAPRGAQLFVSDEVSGRVPSPSLSGY